MRRSPRSVSQYADHKYRTAAHSLGLFCVDVRGRSSSLMKKAIDFDCVLTIPDASCTQRGGHANASGAECGSRRRDDGDRLIGSPRDATGCGPRQGHPRPARINRKSTARARRRTRPWWERFLCRATGLRQRPKWRCANAKTSSARASSSASSAGLSGVPSAPHSSAHSHAGCATRTLRLPLR